ncbi:MAG: HAMP domain-containing histidine kinase [Gemmatimonadetes bacterium]|nr:HAMP domain-containing histidine kinase [Gemmatimonadota bacterium]
MTLRARLSLTIAGIGVILVLPAAYGLTQLAQLRAIASTQRSRHGEAYIALGDLQTDLAELDRLQRSYIVGADTGVHRAMLLAVQTARSHLERLRDAGYPALARVAANRVDSLAVATRRLELLVQTDRADEAASFFDDVRTLHAGAQSIITDIGGEIDRRSARDLLDAGRISRAATTTTLAALLFSIGIAALIGAWTTRALTLPIVRLRNSMAVVADGRFTVPADLAYGRRDEIGSAARSFRSMTHRLAELDRMKAEFVSIATHELRTPLNVISGYAELLGDGIYGPLSPAQNEALEAIRDQSRVLSQLVNQLLDVSRFEAGGLSLHIRAERTSDLFARIERAFGALAQRKAIELNVTVEESVPEQVPMDIDRMSDQVLGNLLSNALKFTGEGGRISVRAWSEGGVLAIEVADTGCGIPAAQLPHVFDKFYQVGDEARAQGAGLGLAIAHDVVNGHGGSITAESVLGRGSTFTIALPIEGALTKDGPGVRVPVRSA